MSFAGAITRGRTVAALWALLVVSVLPAWTQSTQVMIAQLDLRVGGLAASVTPAQPVIPVNVSSGVQVNVTLNGQAVTATQVAQYLGGSFQIEGEFSGPGLSQSVTVPQSPPAVNSLVLDLPSVNEAGNYTLSNLRFVVNGNDVLDLSPSSVVVQVIAQVLVTSVQTQALTLAQIQQMGVVLNSNDYTGFQFTVGLALSSQVVNLSFPVVFDSQGVPVPQPISPPSIPSAPGVSVPVTVVPVLLTVGPPAGGGSGPPPPTLPGGGPIRIPSVLVIPGNVGYLKQFFSAQLYVTNDTPAEANLVVDNVSGTINLPPGPSGVIGGSDEPLGLPTLNSGPEAITMPIVLNGASTLDAGQTGQAQWTIVANSEGFYTVNFGINATLEGLPTGPVNLTGSANGGVLVRNPYFNMTFTVPGVVRSGEDFNVYATVTNISQAPANDLTVAIDAASLSGATLKSPPQPPIPTLAPGDSTTLTYTFTALTTGQVVADYLNFDTQNGTTGTLNFTLGVYANGTPMSPDTIVLPSSVDDLPIDLVNAAMRVLGQAWSVATAPPGTLPATVIPTTTAVVTQKALAFSEAGLRVTLGEPLNNAIRDLTPDWWGGSPVDPGFNQVLQTTPAGQNFINVLGGDLSQAMTSAGGAVPYEQQLAQLEASGSNFVSFAVGSGTGAAPVSVTMTDGSGNQLSTNTPGGSIVGGAMLPLSSSTASTPVLGLITQPTATPYTLLLTPTSSGSTDLSLSIPSGSGTVIRASATGVSTVQGQAMEVVADLTNPTNLVLQVDTNGNGTFSTSIPLTTQTISPSGPNFTSATVIGPDTLSQAAPFGQNMVVLFDRPVDPVTSSTLTNYVIPNNSLLSAMRELSGRLVFANLAQPEGPYVPTTVAVSGVEDMRGVVGPSATVNLASTLVDPGGVVSGQVLNAQGVVSTTATVTYLNSPYQVPCGSGSGMAGVAAVPVNSSGVYQFRYVRQDSCGGPFAVATTDPTTGALQQISSYVRGPGQQIVINLAMLGLGSVSGQVLNLSGQPVANAQVVAVSGSNPQIGGQTYTDGNGNYTISGITVGPFTVTALQGTSLGTSSGNIEGAGTTAVVNVTLNSGSVNVSGTVTQVLSGITTPVSGLVVVYNLTTSNGNPTPMGYALTNASGSYSISNVPAGQYLVQARLGPYAANDIGVSAAGNNIVANLAIVIPTTAVVDGTVYYPNGSPAGGVIVYQGQLGVLSNPDGTFSLGGVPVEPSQAQTIYAITSDGTRSGQTTVIVNSAGQPVTGASITLSGLGTAQYTVLDPNGNPLANQPVIIGPGSPPGCPSVCGCNTQNTNSQGVVTFTGVPTGAISGSALNNVGDFTKATANVTQDGSTGYAVMQFNGTGTVTGTVVDPSNNPVLGATIQLASNAFNPQSCALQQTNSQSSQTGTTGTFQFNNVLVGKVGVTASQSFYPAPVGAQGNLTKNGSSVNFNLQMVSTIAGVLSGVVYLPDGANPAGAGVQVTVNGPLPNVTVTTDSTGTYTFAQILPQGLYTLSAADPLTGGVVQTNVYLIAGQPATQNVTLLSTGTVNVTVVDGAGVPETSAYVTLNEVNYPNASFNGSLSTANQGTVPFPSVFAGPFSVQVIDPEGRAGRAAGVLPQNTPSVNIQVQTTTTGTVEGIFYMPDGATPIPNGTVNLTAGGRVIGQATTLATGNVGYYEFDYVPAGSVQLNAQDPLSGRTGIAAGSFSAQGQVLTLNVIAEGLNTIQGTVTLDGLPEAGANVTITSGNFTASTTASGSGYYLMTGVPEGLVVATASLSNGFLTGTASTTTTGDGNTFPLNVALRSSGSVTGQVMQAGGTTPATSSVVTLTVGGTGGGTLTTTTDTQGNFAFNLVPAGIATVNVQVLGSIDQGSGSVVVPAGGTISTTITLNGIGSISGTALNSTGQPTAGTVNLQGTGAFPYYLTLTAASDGTFSVPQVLAGPFTARLSADIGGFTLYGTASGTITPYQNTNFNIQTQNSGTITGLVLRADGVTLAVGTNVTIQLLTGGGSITVQAQNDGTFSAIGVPLGAFTAQFNDPVSGGIAAIEGQSLTFNGQTLNLGTITLDDSALSVVSTNPTNGASGVGITQPLTVTFSEPVASTTGVYVTQGTSNVYLSSSLSANGETVTLQGTMPDGVPLVLNVTSQVTDVFGRTLLIPQQIQFTTVDLTPPYVVSISPANQAIQVPITSSIVVTFDKALSGTAPLGNVITLSSVGGTITGTTTLSAPTTLMFTPSTPLMNNTIYTVTVNGATSFGGNVQTSAFSSTFVSPETTMPVLQLSSPLNGAYVNTATPTITIQLTDQLTGINPATGTMTIDGVAVTPNVGSTVMTFTPTTPLSSGTHTVTASVANNAGVVGMFSGSFIVDTAPPSVATLTGITAGQTLVGQITISGSATDTISGIAKINFLVDNVVQVALLPPSFTTVFNTAILSDGPHNFAVQAVNNAGTTGSTSTAISANVENVPLSVSITSPISNAYFKGQVTATATASEPVQQIAFTLGSQSYTATASPYQATFSLSGVPDGPTVITATATDFAGGTASTTVTINVKQTPPAAPNGNLIFAEPPNNGYSLVYGSAGAVSAGGLTINIVDTVNQATATATSAVDGSFASSISASVNDTLSLTATDQVGNVSAATLITVRSTQSLPPSSGNTSLVYQGDVADLVGGGSNGLSPGPTNNAVFTLSLNIGQGITRTISYIMLAGPQTFSTNSSNLGVAADVGGPLLNGTNGTINFPVTTGATLTLFAVDNGFIEGGDTYTATAVFTDGSQFVAEYTYVAPANRQYVAHSATITANPPTVVVTGSTASTSIITITNIKDIDGDVVPDGANIALSAANMATVNPAGTPVPSAGGVFIDGTTATNNANFQVYTIKNGTVTATYSTQSITPAAITGTLAVIQMQAADANGNVLGTRVVSSQDINIRASTDTAIVSVSPGSLYADRGNHTSQVTVVLRDANGNVLPDGTQAAITVQGNQAVVNGCCYLASAGGTLVGLAASPNGTSFGLGTMAGGQITFQYTDSGIYQGTNGISPAAIAVLPVNSSGDITTNNAIGTADITLVGAATADINPAQPSVPQVSPAKPLQVIIQDVHNARGNLVPDGSNIGVTASANQSITGGCCYVNSAGGTILDGTPVPSNSNWHYYPLVSNGFVSTYSTNGSTNVNPGQTGTATLQLVMVDPNANVLDINVISTQNIILVPPSNAIGSALPSSVLGDGGIHTSTVVFSPVIDAFGNTIPDGTQLAVTAASDSAITGGGCCYVNSAGGQIVSGTPSTSSPNYKIHTVQNGAVTVTYADQNVTATPGQELTANVSLLEVNSSGQVTNLNEIGIVPVTIAGLTTAKGVASPTSVFANGGDYRSNITLSNFRDAAGNPVPDGTQVAVTAANDSAITGGGCCYVNSAGGAIIGGTVASFSSAFSLFTVTNGQVVLQYSSQGVSVAQGSQTATVSVIPVTPNGSEISNYAIATVSIQLLAPGSANVSFAPVDLTANGNANQSAVTISGLLESDGVTPIPNGALVGLTTVPDAAITSNGCCYITGAGGTLAGAGTSPGDGTLANNNSNFEQFTVAGGQVLASYSDLGITAGVGQTVQSYVAVVPLSSSGAVLTNDAIGVGTVNLHGVTSATGNGPSTLTSNTTANVTFSGIKDSAGNTVPDGTAVAVTAGNDVTLTPNGCCYVTSTGGTIVNGTQSSSNSNFKIFTTVGGSITVTYSSAGASVGTAAVQIVPATPSGATIGNSVLNGGVWNITISN
jgi:large repetitive protein